jgi:adenylylsulfate kinase
MNKNIKKEEGIVSKDDRRKHNNSFSAILWFTGLSGSGKSTLSKNVEKKLFEMNFNTYVLDGDNIRHGVCNDLGFSLKDREENIRRIGEISKLFVDAGVFVCSAFISPYRKDRDIVRKIVEKKEFVEIFVKCPLDVCESRDVKGLYKKAKAGLIKNFTGIDDPYEEPKKPEVVVDTSKESIEESISEAPHRRAMGHL